uniref:Uncharacterized protein n=1 Tax=Anguilla anguilla TaxID=7936 RepID=A0A0E9PZ88_ANGAN
MRQPTLAPTSVSVMSFGRFPHHSYSCLRPADMSAG